MQEVGCHRALYNLHLLLQPCFACWTLPKVCVSVSTVHTCVWVVMRSSVSLHTQHKLVSVEVDMWWYLRQFLLCVCLQFCCTLFCLYFPYEILPWMSHLHFFCFSLLSSFSPILFSPFSLFSHHFSLSSKTGSFSIWRHLVEYIYAIVEFFTAKDNLLDGSVQCCV